MTGYQIYKQINLPWLSAIPEHWEMVRNKVLLSESKATVGADHVNYQLLSLTKGGVIIRDISTGKGKFPSDFGSYKTVGDGQIIFCLFDIDETPRTVGLSKYNGMITGAYDIFSINGVVPRYLEYYYISLDDIKAMRPLYTGLRKVIGISTFMQTGMPLPPRTEQEQIVRYLDWQVSKINKLISAKKKQIALLQEQKRAVVHAAVTKGGEGWQPTRIINLIQSVKAGAWGEEAGGLGIDFGCVRVADFDFEHLRVRNTTYTVRNYQQKVIDSLVLRKGDILIEKSGGGDKQIVGRAVMYVGEAPAMYANFIDAIRPNSNVNGGFLTYLLASQYYLERNRFHFNQTTGIQNLHVKDYLRESVFAPSLKEQQAIAENLDAQCASIYRLIEKISAEIVLLQEYRTRLISDTITGLIDVRSIEIPEYEYVAEEADEISDEQEETEEATDEEA